MASRVEWVEARLQRWAQGVTVGDGSGYPAMSVLHPNWSPPSPGTTPTMKTAPASDVRHTHRAIGRLSARLRDTLVVHYCLKLPMAEQALRLECSEATVYERVARAHGLLAGIFTDPMVVLGGEA
jgi:DNA-directed RNA polymerase specialized sigma24 family protein